MGTAGPSEQTSQLSHNKVSHSEIFPPIDDIHTCQPLQRHDSSIYNTFLELTLSFLEEINRLNPSVSIELLQRNNLLSIWDGMEDFFHYKTTKKDGEAVGQTTTASNRRYQNRFMTILKVKNNT